MSKKSEKIEEVISNMQRMRRGFPRHASSENRPAITLPQMSVLFLLNETGRLRNAELAERLGISPSAATQLIHGLEASGFVVRESDDTDRRVAYSDLSTKGKAYLDRMRKQRAEHMYHVFDKLTLTELEQLAGITAKLADTIQENAS